MKGCLQYHSIRVSHSSAFAIVRCSSSANELNWAVCMHDFLSSVVTHRCQASDRLQLPL